jgi:mRNA-degrading endonuclease RelE of RelBE toxin-antitoxin system
VYEVQWEPAARAFVEALDADDKNAVSHAVSLLQRELLLGERVESDPVPTYKIRVGVKKTQWPNDLRVFFRVSHKRSILYIINVGDHKTSALYPGESIYPDER